MSKPTILQDAQAELNCRARGRDARRKRLEAAGVPLERKALARWVWERSKDEQQSKGYWFRPESVRLGNEDEQLPTFGRFGCRVSAELPMTWSVEVDGEKKWMWRAGGVIGGHHDTADEAMRAAVRTLESAGYLGNWREAVERAIEMCRARHEEHCEKSEAYKRAYGQTEVRG